MSGCMPRATPTLVLRQRTQPLTHLFFDVDGTLIDSRAAIVAALRHAFGTVAGIRFPDGEEQVRWALAARIAETCGHVAPEHAAACEAAYHAYYRDRAGPMVAAFPGVRALLAELRRRGLRLGIVTNKGGARLGLDLDRAGLDRAVFSTVVCAEDTAQRKPHPEPIRLALRRLRAPTASSAYLGDGPHDVDAAGRAGIAALGAGYGYYGAAELRRHHADLILAGPADLLHHLR